MFQYSVSIFSNVDLLILMYIQMDVIVLHLHPLFVILFKVVSFLFLSPSPWFFIPVLLWSLACVEKFYFLPPTSVHATTHTVCTVSQLCEGGWSAVNNQLFGHSWHPRKVLFMRNDLEGPVGNYSAFMLHFPLLR